MINLRNAFSPTYHHRSLLPDFRNRMFPSVLGNMLGEAIWFDTERDVPRPVIYTPGHKRRYIYLIDESSESEGDPEQNDVRRTIKRRKQTIRQPFAEPSPNVKIAVSNSQKSEEEYDDKHAIEDVKTQKSNKPSTPVADVRTADTTTRTPALKPSSENKNQLITRLDSHEQWKSFPMVETSESPDKLIYRFPGLSKDDAKSVKIKLIEGMLQVSARLEKTSPDGYVSQSFLRSFSLPENAVESGIRASAEETSKGGGLQITVPKAVEVEVEVNIDQDEMNDVTGTQILAHSEDSSCVHVSGSQKSDNDVMKVKARQNKREDATVVIEDARDEN
ncbi:hypothetical protein AAMO2058_001121900 [Amorphochlora amoebiformis]|eukprot:238660-Amorphochlora_amoeboformis.AAC.1